MQEDNHQDNVQETQEEICTCPTCTVSQVCLKQFSPDTRFSLSKFSQTPDSLCLSFLTFLGTQASYEVLYGEYMVKAGKGREPPDKSTAAIMESILQVQEEEEENL